MRNQTGYSISRGVAIAAAASALLGLAAVAPTLQAAPGSAPSDAEAPLILAATEGMERRDDRRDDRKDDRGDRRDTRQDCRDEGGLAGKDKRDCKQEGRQEGGSDEGETAGEG